MRSSVLMIVSIFIFACASDVSKHKTNYNILSYEEAISMLQGLDAIDGKVVGIGGSEGRFYYLSRCILPQIDNRRTSELLSSKNPNLRVMGLLSLAVSNDTLQNSKLKQFRSDTAIVTVFSHGCSGFVMSVGSVAVSLISNPYFLGNGPDDNPYGIEN